ncbi:hypothetical protein FisN_2Lh256 [Fistulifera solaris]|uniref:Uncharacterized protein n=1 Tax=Fistulifera solaris TaxID=1519565 RepID=A0A1Z5KFI4_FISSO|nr:hypothetical protein FisN_2Lh256 [Fistulifera solaris]|eukprot:GAX24977.1 hypothetical protein FisN_2Lh256 [Fistulifera solaris]
MLWRSAYVATLSVGICTSTSSAFAPVHVDKRSPQKVPRINELSVSGLGWDNDDFLDSLSKGKDAQAQANERYRSMSRFPMEDDLDQEMTAGAELTEEMKAKIKASRETEESSQGGEMFRKLMERAQENSRPMPPSRAPQTQTPSFENMSVEEQARMFREMMQQQQQSGYYPPPQQTYEPPQVTRNYMGPGVAEDGRKIGRNRDADAIVNSADLYFAQLKRDSSVRNMARYSGDDEFANQVFADPSIKEISMHVNPYMEKEKLLVDTSPDEMILPTMFVDDRQEQDESYAGISYKERMMQKRNKKLGIPTETTTSAPSSPAPAAASEPPKVVPLPTPVALNEEPFVSFSPPPPPKVESEVAPEPVREVPGAPRPAPRVPQVTGDFHKDTRTLMGLTLKHRGGPGFGSGRLRGEEVQRYEELASNLMKALQNEQPAVAAEVSQQSIIPQSTGSPTQQEMSELPDRTNSMVSLIEGAVQLYKNSPPQLQESMLGAVRAALSSAVTTCNEVLQNEENQVFSPMGSSSASNSDRAASMIACVEGATLMYKNSPVELQAAVLPTLRTALLSAIASCDAILANDKVEQVAATQQTSATVPTATLEAPSMGFEEKSDTSSVNAPAAVLEPASNLNTENSKILEDIYFKLQRASGFGKMGLRDDLSPVEADNLAEDLVQVRRILVDELNDVPSPSSSPEVTRPPDDPLNPSISKYQELLAKAKASKEAKDQ